MAPKFEYLQCWFMLHRLVDLGQGDSALADELREEMEHLGWRLPSEATDQVDAISSLLNAERDGVTADLTGRTAELATILKWLSDEYWQREPKTEQAGA